MGWPFGGLSPLSQAWWRDCCKAVQRYHWTDGDHHNEGEGSVHRNFRSIVLLLRNPRACFPPSFPWQLISPAAEQHCLWPAGPSLQIRHLLQCGVPLQPPSSWGMRDTLKGTNAEVGAFLTIKGWISLVVSFSQFLLSVFPNCHCFGQLQPSLLLSCNSVTSACERRKHFSDRLILKENENKTNKPNPKEQNPHCDKSQNKKVENIYSGLLGLFLASWK